MKPRDEILSRLLNLHPKRIDLSLGRIERLLAGLGHPETRLPPVIHVAGTNGKGSTIAFMRAMLEAAGKSVHVYTSPHLIDFNERIRVGRHGGGVLVSDAALQAALERCEDANAGAPITFFEITTAAAFLLFAERPADVLLLEVGLGGRVDATNVVARPALTIVTPVSIDHPEFLGDTIEKIAVEKAGIFKRGVPAILAEQDENALAVLEGQAGRLGAPVIVGGQDFVTHEENGRFVYEDERGLIDLPLPRLVGRHQQLNAGTAIAALRRFDQSIAVSAIETGLSHAEWPARLQRLKRGRVAELAPREAEVWLDGGHNADGGRALAQAMADFEEKSPRPLILVCGTLATKATRAFLRPFKGLVQEVIAVPIGGDHYGRLPAEVAFAAQQEGIPAAASESVGSALEYLSARDWSAPPRILIAGSLYLAGEVLKLDGLTA
ncbi:MAG TPA: folylpolyglutamate synthase/dihydrofolate synthase family protein [Beijerinckiaceae bacterium]|jgi:dihydrofolate synthase/folylpolyglutamate synthase|nr:folylpolyglutamate synthase/dihydrofolate synthase family protein [Beijerinckiaceae bacterium]